MEERAGGDRGLQPTTGAHPQPCARAPAVTAAAVWTREPVRPAQFGQILPTGPLVGEPRPKLLVSPRIVTPTDRSQIASHDRPPYCTQADMQDIDSYQSWRLTLFRAGPHGRMGTFIRAGSSR